jgi:hypothetical protein
MVVIPDKQGMVLPFSIFFVSKKNIYPAKPIDNVNPVISSQTANDTTIGSRRVFLLHCWRPMPITIVCQILKKFSAANVLCNEFVMSKFW